MEGLGEFYAQVNKLCTACGVYCVVLQHEQQPQLFHGKPDKHCTRTWLMIEQNVLNYQNNPGVFPRGNPDGFKKRALGKAQEEKFSKLQEMLRAHVDAHSPCYVVLQLATNREENVVYKSGLWERLPVAQAIEMALAFVSASAEPKVKTPKEPRPAAIKALNNGEQVSILSTKRLRKCLQEQWPAYHMETKGIFVINLSDYPGLTLEQVVKRVRRWEELIKDGKEVKIIKI